MKILITGHMGFVGRNFIKALGEKHEIVGIDIKEGNDCRDFFRYRRDHFDLVIHLAAIVGGRATIEGEPLKVATDLSIDAEFFNWVSITKPTDVVYFSSSAAYPTVLQEGMEYKLRERDINLERIGNPDLTYGWAKLTGEMLAEFVTDSNMYVFRPFSGYGSDQDNSYPFPAFIDRALAKADPFDIWGDGEQARDFIHIYDIVDAVLFHVENKIVGTFNLCNGVGTTFNELAKMVCDLAGYSPEFRHNLDAPEGVRYRVGNPYLSHSIFQPKTSLTQGILKALSERAQAVE